MITREHVEVFLERQLAAKTSDSWWVVGSGLLFHRIAALVLLLVVGHQDSRADMRAQIGDADFVGWKMRPRGGVASDDSGSRKFVYA